MIRTCTVLAVDGTHSSGKSTLTAALVDHYRAAGLDTAHVGDLARVSPLVAATVADPHGTFDLAAELDLVAATISAHLRAAAGRQLLVVDKTVANVLAYADLFLDTDNDTVSAVLSAAHRLCHAWQPYDLVVRCRDHYRIDLAEDPYRTKVTDLQAGAARSIRSTLVALGYPVVDLPTGLSTLQRLTWVTARPALSHLAPA